MKENNSSPTEGRAWTPKTPFSQRQLREDVSPQPTTPEVLGESHSNNIEPEISTEPVTAPLPIMHEPRETFRILKPEEVSDEEIRLIQLQMTAYYHTLKILHEEEELKRPATRQDRQFIWHVIFKLMANISIGLVLTVALLVIMFNSGNSFWSIVPFSALMLLIVIFATWWLSARAVRNYKTKYMVCDTYNTGWQRPASRFFLLSELVPSLETASINTRNPGRGKLSIFLKLNCWRVTLDAPSQADNKTYEDMRFIRNGDLLVQTIIAQQKYLSTKGR